MESQTEGAILLSSPPVLLFVSQTDVLPKVPTPGCRLWTPWLSGTAAHLLVLCVLIAFGWFYRYDGKFPTIRKVGCEAECYAMCH